MVKFQQQHYGAAHEKLGAVNVEIRVQDLHSAAKLHQ